jgi:hypothetical protein
MWLPAYVLTAMHRRWVTVAALLCAILEYKRAEGSAEGADDSDESRPNLHTTMAFLSVLEVTSAR